jgi:putative ABC transport system substrate-binding protein
VKRRAFIAALGGAAAWPVVARGQQGAMPAIGFLGSATMVGFANYVAAFRQGLAEAGYAQDRNVAIKYRWADGQYDRMRGIVADFLRDQTVLIVLTGSTAAVQAAKAATQTTPIVFVIGGDPVKFGLVASLNRPGGNVTGVSFLANSLVAKQLDVLRELVPAAVIIGFLINPNNPNAESDTKNAHLAAETLGRKLVVVSALTNEEVDSAFAILTQERANALLVSADPLFIASRDRVLALARRHALPTMYNSREICFGRWTLELWAGSSRCLPSSRHPGWPHSQRQKPVRPACGAANQVRVGDQPQNLQDTWPGHSTDPDRPRRPGHRMRRRAFIAGDFSAVNLPYRV